MARTKKKSLISIVVPAKDEEENIGHFLKRVKRVIKKNQKYKFEVIVVCDNCIDSTEKVVKKHQIKSLVRKRNPGKSKALFDGFRFAKGNILVMMDADLSHLPEELPEMIKRFDKKKNIGLVIASRELGRSEDVTPIRRFGGISLNFLTNLLFETKLTDAINGYKIFYREVFDSYDYEADGYAIEIELIANALRCGYEVAEIPSLEAKRFGGVAKSKVIKDGWLFLKEVLEEGIKYRVEKLRKILSL